MTVTYRTKWAHPDRHRQRRATDGDPHVFVIHTSEQPFPTATNGEVLADVIAGPKTPRPDGTFNVASYHWCADSDSVNHMVRVLDLDGRDDIAHHAPPNGHGEALCLTGRAARDWTGTDDNSDADKADVDDWPQLRLAARFTAWRLSCRGWPAVKLTPAQVKAGAEGVCGHHDISLAFGQTDHTDPGAGFPWAWFIDETIRHMQPLEEEPLKKLIVKSTDPALGEAFLQIDMVGFNTPAQRDAHVAMHNPEIPPALTPDEYRLLRRLAS